MAKFEGRSIVEGSRSGSVATRAPSHGAQVAVLAREAVIITDVSGGIVFWNESAAQLYGWREEEVLGVSPVELLKTELPRPLAQIENILRGEEYWDYELSQTTRDGKQVITASRWALVRDAHGEPAGRLQLDRDITRRRKAERDLKAVSGRLLNLRDEERRRLARDLHDSVGQLLALTKVNLSSARRHLTEAQPQALKLFNESCELIEEALSEVRTISYLLHPPLLEELGLSSVLSWYVAGFSQRSGIRVELAAPERMPRFSHELETAVFRIIQECLTNVHRHSQSKTAKIELMRSKNQLRLVVEDNGVGLSDAQAGGDADGSGVGIGGIRERVRQLGGEMRIRSGDWGTAVEVEFPLNEHLVPQAVPGADATKR
ncbi:MAG TPA: PAS domain S-box protein [Candidatus Acidoferrales bacterium]|nr:PAS domain S-box protein [Candidatus Acidoferrales bacterium]